MPLKKIQRRLVVCGHDHGTSRRNGVWLEQMGRTTVINVGENMDGPLHAAPVLSRGGDLFAERLVREV
jgi:hypothetical protein